MAASSVSFSPVVLYILEERPVTVFHCTANVSDIIFFLCVSLLQQSDESRMILRNSLRSLFRVNQNQITDAS